MTPHEKLSKLQDELQKAANVLKANPGGLDDDRPILHAHIMRIITGALDVCAKEDRTVRINRIGFYCTRSDGWARVQRIEGERAHGHTMHSNMQPAPAVWEVVTGFLCGFDGASEDDLIEFVEEASPS